ncbi:hypothetical protein IAR55_000697 [Kwoniella newhampshirensis]|uniref:N-acetyltransferase domain-containing protein n=1 Tax=Kwoniella newhampshirensis TaxID=1651941 RepID=A0AAW0Z7P9_9TREE
MTLTTDKPDPNQLSYRIPTEKDYPLLVQFRRECGWGIPKLESKWKDPNWVYCVFELPTGEGVDDVGMACWVLEDEDPDTASRVTNTVYLGSLFIREKYQGTGLGTKAMDLLENAAVEQYHAKWITLDTTAYRSEVALHGREASEDPTRPGKSVAWYKARGYAQYKENRPTFPVALPGKPDHLLTAMFLRKPASLVPGDK